MKKHAKSLIMPVLIIGLLALVFTFNGCKKANPILNCSEGTDDGCGNKWEACCSAVQCYYSYMGKKYNCDGLECDDAATDLANDIMNCSSMNINSLVISNNMSELIEVVEMLKEANLECEEF